MVDSFTKKENNNVEELQGVINMLESLDDKNNGTEADGEPSDSDKLADLSALVSPKSL